MPTPQQPASVRNVMNGGPLRAVPAARRQSRPARWYPVWRLASALLTVAAGVILHVAGHWWALALVGFGLATLLITRFGQVWRPLPASYKLAALPGC